MDKFYIVKILHSHRTIDKLQGSSAPVTLSRKISPYQSHALRVIVLDVLCDVPVCHPLGDHGESCVGGVFPLADADKPQDIRMIQRLPQYHLLTKPPLKSRRDVSRPVEGGRCSPYLPFQMRCIIGKSASSDGFESYFSLLVPPPPYICEPSCRVVGTVRFELDR